MFVSLSALRCCSVGHSLKVAASSNFCVIRSVAIMVNKCSAYGCKSGYTSNRQTDLQNRVTFHVFPLHNKELCDKWVKANPRKDFIPNKNSRLCSLHFQPDDFVKDRTDANATRKKLKGSLPFVRRQLKKDAVPSLFPNAPTYLSTSKTKREGKLTATAASRRDLEASRLEDLEQSFVDRDDLSALSLLELASRLHAETTLPSGFTVTLVDDFLLIYLLNTNTAVTTIGACIKISVELVGLVSMKDKVVPASQYTDLLPNKLEKMSQLVNLMARLKSWHSDEKPQSFSFNMEMATTVLTECIETLEEDSDEHRKISFIIEQLQLIRRQKFGRQYSPHLTILAYMVNAASSAAYRVLRDEAILCLPSVSTLKKINRRLGSDGGIDNASYLKMRISKLNNFERSFLLIIDEIYIAKRVEYSAGSVQGLTADGAIASTLLCFMIKSLCSKYKDIVAIYPMSKLTAAKQFECYKEVMRL